ncbi:MAG: master DNA invertase Mpi family serine-type recombinase [Alphaproteobacteria bacterium]|nr:master DNA invertase Mpi family serine-type recombinase [Alphaproteobacteria bacterium]
MTTYGYIRVSTDKQTTENQRFEIQHFASDQKITINQWINETVSGTVSVENRKLGKLLKKLTEDDILIATEISRLGRNMLQIMSILHHCLASGAQVWTVKDNFRLGQDIQSKVLAFAFGLSAEIERNLISQRTKEALRRKKALGTKLGRPQGTLNKKRKLTDRKEEVSKLLNQGISKAKISRMLDIDISTLRRFIAHDLKPKS